MKKNILLLILICCSTDAMKEQSVVIQYTNKFMDYDPNELQTFLNDVKNDVEQESQKHPLQPIALHLDANMLGYIDNHIDQSTQQQLLANFFRDLERYPITNLNLYRNLLETIPETLCNLRFLRTLNLSHNCLGTVPKAILEMQSLRAIDLHENRIRELPSGIRRTLPLTIDLGRKVVKKQSEEQIYLFQQLPIDLMLNPSITIICSLYQLGIFHCNMQFENDDQRKAYLNRYRQILGKCLQLHPEFGRSDMRIDQ